MDKLHHYAIEMKEVAYLVVSIYSMVTCLVLCCLLYKTHYDISKSHPSSGRLTINGVLKVVNNLSSEDNKLNNFHRRIKIEVEDDDDVIPEDEDAVVIPQEGEDGVLLDGKGAGAGRAFTEVGKNERIIPGGGGTGAGGIPKERGENDVGIPHKEGVDDGANGTEVRAPLGNDLSPFSPANVSETGYYILDTNQPFIKRCGRCALVSSGGHLYRSGAGAEIDSAECVLRMNTAPVTGWSTDVGIRTDIRIIGHVNIPRGLVKMESLRNEILSNSTTRARYIVVPWLRQDTTSMKTTIVKIARQFKYSYPGVDFVFLTSKKNAESEDRYKEETGYSRAEMRTSFSTGFVSLMFALDICDEVLVYGISSDDFCKKNPKSKVPYHYYEPGEKSECFYTNKMEMNPHKGHKFLTEHAMFARWSSFHNITFHYPSWKASKESKRAVGAHFLKKYKETLNSRKKGGKKHVRVIHKKVPRTM